MPRIVTPADIKREHEDAVAAMTPAQRAALAREQALIEVYKAGRQLFASVDEERWRLFCDEAARVNGD